MAPNQRECSKQDPRLNEENNFPTTNENDSISLSDVDIWTNSDGGPESEEHSMPPETNLTLQNDLRDLLIKVTSTEDLQTVTQIKLKVITREISLQQLKFYTPALRELTLDGSYVSSLRDLGCELKNLRVLRMNRCSLRYLDSVSAIENLEEIYISDNLLEDVSSCAFLPHIKIIDVRRNQISSLRGVFFLSLCSELQQFFLAGNSVAEIQNYVQEVKNILPTLMCLDGFRLEVDRNAEGQHSNDNVPTSNKEQLTSPVQENSRTTARQGMGSFVIQFPPRVLMDSSGKTNK